jgi:hypothetical protein
MKRVIYLILIIIMSFLLIRSGSRSVKGTNLAPVTNAGMDKVIQ